MDLNYLYHRLGESLLRARGAASLPARRAHEALAVLYSEQITRLRRVRSARAEMVARHG
jgi:hypothetical protein